MFQTRTKACNTIMCDRIWNNVYENDDGEHVVLNKDPQCLRIAIASSPVIPGTDLKRLKVEIFEGSYTS